MPAALISFDDVQEAATAMKAEGRKITILAVRERLGRGSFTTVKKFLEQWRGSSADGLAVGNGHVPPQLGSLWEEARKAAHAELAAERAELEQLATDLQGKFEALERRAVQAEVRLADRDAEVSRSTRQIEHLQDLLASSHEDAAATRAELARFHEEARGERQRWQEALTRADANIIKIHGPLESMSGQVVAVIENLENYIHICSDSHARIADQYRAIEERQAGIERRTGAIPAIAGGVEEVGRAVRQIRRESTHGAGTVRRRRGPERISRSLSKQR